VGNGGRWRLQDDLGSGRIPSAMTSPPPLQSRAAAATAVVPPGALPPPLFSTPRAAVRCRRLEARDYLGQSDETTHGSWPRVCNLSTCPSPTSLVFFSIRQVSSCFLSRSPSILSWYCVVFFCCYCVVRLCAAGSAAAKSNLIYYHFSGSNLRHSIWSINSLV
jgi:hypothetical protein